MKYVNFDEWSSFLDRWFDDFRNNQDHHIVPVTDTEKGLTRITNTLTGKSVVSKCHKNDCFDAEVGIAVAWARYNGAEIPTLVEDNNERSKLEILDILEKFNIKSSKVLEAVLKNYRNIIDIISGGDCKDIRICNNDLMDYLAEYVNMNIREHTTDYPIRWENNR
jgi:hypothetical protein